MNIKMSYKPFTFKDAELQKAFYNIVDTFTGADGGIAFINLRTLLTKFENPNSISEEESCKQILTIVKQFSKLIDVVNGVK